MKKQEPIDPFIQKVADRIKSLRKERGYTNYEDFAFEKGIPRAQFGRYEKGTDMRITSLHKVVRALDLTMEEFFAGMDKPTM